MVPRSFVVLVAAIFTIGIAREFAAKGHGPREAAVSALLMVVALSLAWMRE